MRYIISFFVALVLLSSGPGSTITAQNPTMKDISVRHDAYWTKVFGTAKYPDTDIAFIVTKFPNSMLYVVRNNGVPDTLAAFGICSINTVSGPKTFQGDMMTPEGVYYIDMMNPRSSYHLSMRINYPNAADRARHRWVTTTTHLAGDPRPAGGDIFIHGDCVTAGCVAMGNDFIERLYLLVDRAQKRGQKRVPVLIVPFDDPAYYNRLIVDSRDLAKKSGLRLYDVLGEHWTTMRTLWDWYPQYGTIPSADHDLRGVYMPPELAHH